MTDPPRDVLFLTAVGAEVFFAATDDGHGRELWRSDGTPEGTVMVRDINPNGSSDPGHDDIDGTAVVGDTLFFTARDGVHGTELWKSDGTRRGTRMVKDISSLGGSGRLDELTGAGKKLFFTFNNGRKVRLWKSDGTAKGTVRVKSRGRGPNLPTGLTRFRHKVFFSAQRRGEGKELWRSNGWRRGTELVKNIRAGSLPSKPSRFAAADSVVYFVANDGISRFNNTGVWKTDGSRSGTQYVRNVDPLRDLWDDPPYPEELTTIEDRLFFVDQDCTHGYELWTSDGTTDGTTIIDIQPGDGDCGDGSDPAQLTVFQGEVFFGASLDGRRGLWRSDGTEVGTMQVKDLREEGEYANFAPIGLTVLGDMLYFFSGEPGSVVELWKSDGTEAGTTKVVDTGGSFPQSPTTAGGLLFFSLDGALWKTDGTEAGTGPVVTP